MIEPGLIAASLEAELREQARQHGIVAATYQMYLPTETELRTETQLRQEKMIKNK